MDQQEKICRKHDFIVLDPEGFLRTCLSCGYVEDFQVPQTDQKTDPWQGWVSAKIRPLVWPQCVEYSQMGPRDPSSSSRVVYSHRPNMQTSQQGEPQRESRPYVYSDLSELSHIRLLKLSHGTRREALSGSLLVVDCKQIMAPVYSALSYTWADYDGDTSLSRRIFLGNDERVLPITFNCDRALRCLRQRNSSIFLWVDSICINQSSPSERSHQVGLMNIIYSNATTVHAYVGEENYGKDETGAEAMALLKDLQGTNNSDVSSLNETSDIEILNQFFSRSYFVRLWIVQELLLSQSITLHCGQLSLEISNKLISQLYEQSVKVPSWFRFTAKPESQSQRTPVSLMALLAATGVCHMTDLRDRVFGLLGLVGDDQALDLSPSYELSVREVYVGIAAYLIKNHLCCDLIQRTNPYWIKDKWRSPSDFGIPSWVPTWGAYVPLQAPEDLNELIHQIKFDCKQLATERLQLDGFAIRVLEGWPHRCVKTGQRCKAVYAESAFLASHIEIAFRFKSSFLPFATQPAHAEPTSTPQAADETDDHKYVTSFWHPKGGLVLAVRSFAWVLRLLHHDKGLDEFHLIRIKGCSALFLAGQCDGSSQYRLIGPCVAALLWQTNGVGYGEKFKADDLHLFSQFKPLTVEMARFMAQWKDWVFEIARSDLTDGEHGYDPCSIETPGQSYPPPSSYGAFLDQKDWETAKNDGELEKQLPTVFKFWHDVHGMYDCFNHWESSTNEVRMLIATWKTSREVTPLVLLNSLADWRNESNGLTRAFQKTTGGNFIIPNLERVKPLIETLINLVSRAADTNLCDEGTVHEITQEMETILMILKDDWQFFDKAFPSKLESIHPAYTETKQTMEWAEIFRDFLKTGAVVKWVTFY